MQCELQIGANLVAKPVAKGANFATKLTQKMHPNRCKISCKIGAVLVYNQLQNQLQNRITFSTLLHQIAIKLARFLHIITR